MRKLLSFYLCAACCFGALAQKKVLDHTVYDDWKRINSTLVSPKGDRIGYEVVPQEGDGKFVFHSAKQGQDIVIDRGYRATLTPDGKYAICLIKPPFQDTRQAKIEKKKEEDMPKDSLAIISFANASVVKFAHIQSYKIGKETNSFIAFATTDTTLVAKKDRKNKNVGNPLIVYHLQTGKTDTISYVKEYSFNKDGSALMVLTQKEKNQQTVECISTNTMNKITLAKEEMFCSLPVFDNEGQKALFLASSDSIDSGSKRCGLYLFHIGDTATQKLIDRSYALNQPEGWTLNENSAPFFSRDGKTIFAGVAPVIAAKDTTIVPFETAQLDLWHYADPQLITTQLKNLNRDRKRTIPALFLQDSHSMQPLTDSFFDRMQLIAEGNASVALSIDKTPYMVESQWNNQNNSDLSLVDVKTGNRTPIATGCYGSISASPQGKYIVWYNLEDRNWYLYDINTKATHSLTQGMDVNFWDEENDAPQHPRPYGIAGWTKDDREILIYDRYDIWKFSTQGNEIINLTNGEGRRTSRIYRYIDTKSEIQASPGGRGDSGGIGGRRNPEPIAPNETLLLSIFDEQTKEYGFATVKNAKSNSPSIAVIDKFNFSGVAKAKEADVYLYQKGNFNTSIDLYITQNRWKKETKLTDINPQMKDYKWGTVELTTWKAHDGTQLEGLIYKPEDFDPTKKYPVMIYFYERYSHNLYTYFAPAPSRSIINIPFYCSRGYIVFVPDIVYTEGQPGESAYNSIVSGAKALAQNPWVDADNMAIQGQSWGGYQVAYLITRTNMFKAAGAGAPVANMTSAYGGIRWESGASRQFQYEKTQSRIGKTLWEAPELYIANSPLFFADKVNTPLLMMHNDNDGAVPWYQGIEYFTALRRLGKQVWMLQYNNEEHNLKERRNMKDLTIRLQQFFDHYLKGEPEPAWMKSGIPALRKGQYFGLETE